MVVNAIPGSVECQMVVCNSVRDVAKSVAECGNDERRSVWVNLTNGIEVIPYLESQAIQYKFCRFRSCSFEQANWNDAIADMPDDMLMGLATGSRQIIVDFGANRPCPRSLRQGVMIAIRRISLSWGFDVDKHMWICDRQGKPMVVGDEFARQTMRIDKKQASRLKYFRKYVNTDALKITMVCSSTSHDGDYEMHANIVKGSNRSE